MHEKVSVLRGNRVEELRDSAIKCVIKNVKATQNKDMG